MENDYNEKEFKKPKYKKYPKVKPSHSAKVVKTDYHSPYEDVVRKRPDTTPKAAPPKSRDMQAEVRALGDAKRTAMREYYKK